MFTGLIEEIGLFAEAIIANDKYIIKIKCEKVIDDAKIGDSIALNGMCVTIVDLGDKYFKADIMPESINRSSLKYLQKGSRVNLERALKLSDRLGGHLISGHIDGTAVILSIIDDRNAVRYKFRTENNLAKYIVNKGSISIDGTSLTIVEVLHNEFQVSLIPLTAQKTILSLKKIGDIVNIECDIIGKYIEKFVSPDQNANSKITMKMLLENGFA